LGLTTPADVARLLKHRIYPPWRARGRALERWRERTGTGDAPRVPRLATLRDRDCPRGWVRHWLPRSDQGALGFCDKIVSAANPDGGGVARLPPRSRDLPLCECPQAERVDALRQQGQAAMRRRGFVRPFELEGQYGLPCHGHHLVGERVGGRSPPLHPLLMRPTRFFTRCLSLFLPLKGQLT